MTEYFPGLVTSSALDLDMSLSTGKVKSACPRQATVLLRDYAKLDRKGFQSLKALRTKSKIKALNKAHVTCSPGSGNWRVELVNQHVESDSSLGGNN